MTKQPKFVFNTHAIVDRLRLVAMQMDMNLNVRSGDNDGDATVGAYLEHKTIPDYKIFCYAQTYNFEKDGKVNFSTYFSRDIVSWDSTAINSCQSSISKDISKIVKDIQTKVLEGYEENLKEHKEREQIELAKRDNVRKFKDELQEKKLLTYYSDNSSYEYLQVPLKSAKITVNDTGTVRIQLDSLTQDEARYILEAIQNIK
jgi:hypothetical protein